MTQTVEEGDLDFKHFRCCGDKTCTPSDVPGLVGYPSCFHVEQHPRNATEFDFIVRALKSVFHGSIETGNPVRWS